MEATGEEDEGEVGVIGNLYCQFGLLISFGHE